jgi:hypothetical protein
MTDTQKYEKTTDIFSLIFLPSFFVFAEIEVLFSESQDMDNVLDIATAAQDSVVTQFETYEEYLDSQVTPKDLTYLEDEDLARALVELGYAGSGETLSREEFYKRKQAIELSRQQKLRAQPKALASANKDLTSFPLLQALAAREEMVRNGKLTVRPFSSKFLHLVLTSCFTHTDYHFHPRSKPEGSGSIRIHRLCTSAQN